MTLVLAYAVLSGVWILLSDEWLQRLLDDPRQIMLASMLKDGLFVGVTAGLLYILLRRSHTLALLQAERQCEGERRRALDLLAAIADSSEDAIFAKDLEGRYTLFNRAASLITGQPAEAVLGFDDRALFPAEQAGRLMAAGRQVVAGNRAICQEEVLSVPGGERVFLTTKGPLRDADGKVVGLFGISRDITEQKQALERLKASEERLHLALDAADAGLWDWDLRSGLAYLTPRYYEMTGYRPGDVTPNFEFFQRMVHPDDLPRVLETVDAHLQGKIPISAFDYRILTPAGELRWISGQGRVVEWDAEGAPLRMVGTILDITARKAAEEALGRQAEELARHNVELERFNHAMVGREMDMIALKQQINGLSRQLGREPPYPLAFLGDEPVPDGTP